MPQRVLVTGGSGFIGGHLVRALASRGDDVLNLDLMPPPAGDGRGRWAKVDLLDRAALQETVAEFRPEILFNLAAVADISLAYEQMLPNTVGLRNLLAAAAALPDSRIIHASTQLVVRPGYAPSGPTDWAPYTVYGETKADSERILWEEAGGLAWTIVRPTAVWGPGHPSFARSTWKYLNRRWYMLPTGSNPIRSYGYVANVVSQLIAAGTLGEEAVARKVFYVGDAPIPLARWLDGFSCALTGKPTRRIPGAMLKAVATLGELSGRIGGPSPINLGRLYRITTDYAVPMEESIACLGRGPVSLDEGIAQTVEWLKQVMPQEYGRR